MEIIHKYPPNYKEIKSKLKPTEFTIYCYGDKIFNPSGLNIPEDLIVHESVHFRQQKEIGVERWWSKYLEDDKFRLDQEVEAYREQARYIDNNYSRSLRKRLKEEITIYLSSEIYGSLITKEEAKQLIYE